MFNISIFFCLKFGILASCPVASKRARLATNSSTGAIGENSLRVLAMCAQTGMVHLEIMASVCASSVSHQPWEGTGFIMLN